MPKGPLLLTSITPEQLSPDYWIHRLPDPDRVLKTSEELAQLDEDTRQMIRDQVDLFKMDLVKRGASIREQLKLEYQTVQGRILYDVHDPLIPKSFFEENIRPIVQWEKVPEKVRLKWGAAIRPTSVRALPTDVKMLEEIGDIEFDQLQFTLIKLWTPVALYHTASGGKWLYIQAPYARGWVKAQDIAFFSNREELKSYIKRDPFLVVMGESVPLFTDLELKEFDEQPTMGTLLPLIEPTGKAYAIWMPGRRADGSVFLRQAYLDRTSDVSFGFPPFTQRHILRQAFKLVGARYGWGGMYNGRDCSGFIQDVFLSMGVDMPRDSKGQAFVGTQLGHFRPLQDETAKIWAIRSGAPGLTLFRMPLHMMLYLGEVNGQFYVIHSTWAERISMTSDEKVRINQVVVSDLTLNGRSYLGSLFDRIISVNELN